MARDFTNRRRFIITGLALLLTADVALAAYSWQLGSSGQLNPRMLSRQAEQLKLLEADIERAKKIQKDMPAVQKDCDKFVEMLFPAATGYSSSSADLHDMAKTAGVQIQDLDFRQKQDPAFGLNLTRVEIAATVSGDYKSVVHFVNNIQRSPNHYLLDDLHLTGDTQNPAANSVVKVGLHLQTYFRGAV
jgi:type IV pilus assembly protein PilO